MTKYMTPNDVYLEFREKINCVRQFEMISEEEKQVIIENGIKKIVQDLYDLSLPEISYLKKRNTYIIRKLYGILDDGKCIPGPIVKEEFDLSNIHTIKPQFFKKINIELEKYLISYNFSKKKKEILDLIGIDLNLFKLNLVAFNSNSKMMNFDEYIMSNSFKIISQEINETNIYIKSDSDLNLADLTDKEIQIISLYFGLNANKRRYTLKEISTIFKMSKENVRLISLCALEKLKKHFLNPLKVEYFDTIECLNLSKRPYRSLKKAGIYSMENLLKLSKRELLNIKGLGEKSLEEIYNSIQIFKNKATERQTIIDTKKCLLEELQCLQKRKENLEMECQKLDFLIAQAKIRYEKFEEIELIKKRTYKF